MLALMLVLALGCALALVSAAVAIRCGRSLPQLAEQPSGLPVGLGRWPTVTVVIPARNEERAVATALRSRLADDYPALDVVFVDDRSTDGTAAIAGSLAAEDPRLKVVSIEALPEGWLGKVHALHRGTRVARGEWLLFSDADVHVSPGTLRCAVAYAEARRLDMLTAIPEFECPTLALDATVTVMLRVLLVGMPPWKVSDPRSSVAVGCGAFNLVSRSSFERTPGFEWLRMEAGDDLGVGVLMKTCGFRTELVGARGGLRLEFYRNAGELWRSMEKNATIFRLPALLAMTFAVLAALFGELAPLGAIALGAVRAPWLLALGVLSLVAATAGTALVRYAEDGRILPALAWPLGSPLLLLGMLRSFWLGYLRGGVQWRDTFYAKEQVAEGARVFSLKARRELAATWRGRPAEEEPEPLAAEA